MLKNYIIIAYRNLVKYKTYSLINIIGFSIALVPVVLTILYVVNEFSYDKYNKNYDRIYRVTKESKFYRHTVKTAIMPNPLAFAMKAELPQVQFASRLSVAPAFISYKKQRHDEKKILYADPDIFNIFTFHIAKGNLFTAATDKYSILLSESMAKKYFGNKNPLGKTMKLRDVYYMTVIGVFRNMPVNSHFHANFIVPASILDGSSAAIGGTNNPNAWGFSMFYTYFLLRKGADINKLQSIFPKFINKYSQNYSFNRSKISFQPLGDIHLHSHLQTELENNGDITTVYLYMSVAFIILLIASINYINLATARYSRRTKEMGMRKIMGAYRKQLIKQLLTESTIVTYFSFVITIVLVELLLPHFNNFIERNIQFNIVSNFGLFIWIAIFAGFISIAAGFYPAIFLSSAKPLSYIGGSSILRTPRFRNALIITQFVLAMTLIFCTIVVSEQLYYITNKNLGYNKKNIILFHVSRMSKSRLDALKNEIANYPGVVSVSSSDALPNTTFIGGGIDYPGKPNDVHFEISHAAVDYNFLDLYGIKIVEGRKFLRQHPSDGNNAIILNETAVHELGWENPIGRRIRYTTPYGSSYRKVIGVARDFNTGSLYKNIMPYYFTIDSTENVFWLSVKIKPANIHKTLMYLLKEKKKFTPDYPVNYEFFSDFINSSYGPVYKLQSLFSAFSLFTIIIASLGLYGIISFLTEIRKKEIGIRKVLGASIYRIAKLFTWGVIIPVFFAGLISIPLAYIIMNKWLANFAYKTNFHIGIYVFAALIVFLISLTTVLIQVFKISSVNPVESLRNE